MKKILLFGLALTSIGMMQALGEMDPEGPLGNIDRWFIRPKIGAVPERPGTTSIWTLEISNPEDNTTKNVDVVSRQRISELVEQYGSDNVKVIGFRKD